MKKLIGLLGAAGLLIPSAAMAGNIGSQTGSSAIRVTGTSSSLTQVSVDSSIHRTADMHVGGINHGHSFDFSAENATVGYRGGGYGYDQTTGSAATNVDAEVEGGYGRVSRHAVNGYVDGEAEGDVTVTREHTPGSEGHPGYGCSRWGCLVDPQEAQPEVTSTNYEGDVAFAGEAGGERTSLTHAHGGYVEADGYLNGGYDDSNIVFTGGGHEHFLNGAASGSIDEYTNGYLGSLTETGDTHTSVDAWTSATSTSRGFESGSFTNTDWN